MAAGASAIASEVIGLGQGVIDYDVQQAEFARQKREAEIAGREVDYREGYLEDVYGFQQEGFALSEQQTRAKTGFALESLGIQEKGLGVAERKIGVSEGRLDITEGRLDVSKRLVEIEGIKSQIQTAFQGSQLIEARSLAGKKARLQAEELSTQAAFRGRSATFRAGIAQGLGEISGVESQLVVNRTLGLLSEEQTQQRLGDIRLQRQDIGKQREGLSLQREELGLSREQIGVERRSVASQQRFALEGIGLERRAAAGEFEFEKGSLDFERERIASEKRAAEEKSEAGGLFGEVYGAVGETASFAGSSLNPTDLASPYIAGAKVIKSIF